MAQIMRPIDAGTPDDITNTNGSPTPGYTQVDGAAPDTDTYWSGNDNATGVLEVLLEHKSSTPPGAGTCTVTIYQAQADGNSAPSSGGTNATFDLEVYEGTTQRASVTGVSCNEGSFASYSALTFAASAITDWANVRVRFTSNGTGGSPSSRRGAAVSYIELSIPDYVAPTNQAPTPAGVSASAAAGTFTKTLITAGILGVAATGSIGDAVASTGAGTTNAEGTAVGVSSSAQAGEVTVIATTVTEPAGVAATATADNVTVIPQVVVTITPTGVVATITADNVTTATTVNQVPVGAEATAAAGIATGFVIASKEANPVGVEATAAAGTATGAVAGDAEATPDGAEATAQAGSLGITSPAVFIAGVEAVSAIGDVEVTAGFQNKIVPVTGVEATAVAGSLGITSPNTFIAGVEATGAVGLPLSPIANFENQEAFPVGVEAVVAAEELLATSIAFEPDGASAAASVGTATASANVQNGEAYPVGVEATAVAEQLEASSFIIDEIDGVSAATTAGDVTVELSAVAAYPAGVEATAAAGTATGLVSGSVQPTPDGVEAIASAGEVIPISQAVVAVTGVEAAISAGTASASVAGGFTNAEGHPEGVSAVASAGEVTIQLILSSEGTISLAGELAASGTNLFFVRYAEATITIKGGIDAKLRKRCHGIDDAGTISIAGSLSAVGNDGGKILAAGTMTVFGSLSAPAPTRFAIGNTRLAYGEITIKGSLSEAYLHKVSCINPTATITILGAVLSAGYTDPNAKFATATITISSALNVVGPQPAYGTITITGDLKARPQNTLIGQLSALSERAKFGGTALIGPGTINGRKLYTLRTSYGSVTIYNNSAGGFYTIGLAEVVKEAYANLLIASTLNASGTGDSLKVRSGSIVLPGDLAAKGRHTSVAGAVGITGDLNAGGGRHQASGNIIVAGDLAASGNVNEVYTLTNRFLVDADLAPGTSEVRIRIGMDGNVYWWTFGSEGTNQTWVQLGSVSEWIRPTTFASSKYVRAILVSGSTPYLGTLNEWQQTNVDRDWGLKVVAGPAGGEKDCRLRIDLGDDGATVIEQAFFDLSVQLG